MVKSLKELHEEYESPSIICKKLNKILKIISPFGKCFTYLNNLGENELKDITVFDGEFALTF